jgi:hypothetical protein
MYSRRYCENIVKQIIRNKLNDSTSSWNCKRGIYSQKEGFKNVNVYERRTSFVHSSSNWDVIYFLDARDWLNDNFIYIIPLQEQRVNGETYK